MRWTKSLHTCRGHASSSPPNYSCGKVVMMATPVVLSRLGVGIAPPSQKHVVCQRLIKTCNRMARYMGRNLLSLLLRVTDRTMPACSSERLPDHTFSLVFRRGLTNTMNIVDSMLCCVCAAAGGMCRAWEPAANAIENLQGPSCRSAMRSNTFAKIDCKGCKSARTDCL